VSFSRASKFTMPRAQSTGLATPGFAGFFVGDHLTSYWARLGAHVRASDLRRLPDL